ncbi:MAG: DUF5694 domain-containing protein [Flavobacteriales bacterium]|nr:DUF5694 domain-containing protein [Flavobacteriales bacterium]
MRYLVIILLIGLLGCKENITEDIPDNSSIDIFDSLFAQKSDVLVLGTFHFDYPGQDVFKTDEKNRIDILSPERQLQLRELLDYIKLFKPNKIAIEAREDWNATDKLRNWNEERVAQERGERYQIGLRLASELNLDTIYAIDEDNLFMDLMESNPNLIEKMTEGSDDLPPSRIEKKYFELWQYSDSLSKEIHLLEYFKFMNSKIYHEYDYGSYFSGHFELDSMRGADILSIWWYNRNLRIFRNIQEITEEGDRLLVLIGNGHAAVLRQLLTCSPKHRFVEFNSL